MAMFEKKSQRKICLDDTETLTCAIENYQNIQGHTEYVIRVQRGPIPEKSWHVCRRYSDFVSLHNALQQSGLPLPLPPKKLIGNMDREFVAERQLGLQSYLNLILMNPILASSLPVRKFLDPENYSTSFQEVALQHVSMALRGEVNYEIMRPIPEMGWRIRKHYFLVKNHNQPKDEMVLSWVEYGPDKHLDDREMLSACKSISSMQHPFIQKPEFINSNEIGGYVVRALNNAGTLRDLLYCSKPKSTFLRKYGNPKQRKPLLVEEVSLYGKQILEALSFLNSKGLPYGHLHPGNVIVENGRIKLIDIENGILGLPSFYRPYILHHKKIKTMEAVDVYCFGHVIYEMAFAYPLYDSVCDILPPHCPPLLRSLLESILSTEACKDGMPSIPTLLAHPFFNGFTSNGLSNTSADEQAYLKFSSHLREALKDARQKMEERLKEEQKMVRQQKRLVKVQELLTTEGDKRNRKQKLKLQEQTAPQQQLITNGKSPERSESPNSTSTATSVGTVTPPSGPFESSHTTSVAMDSSRSALLGSICNFNKAALRHIESPEASDSVGRVLR
ncbi:PX domain-containing protein kinase-like protein isoform X1 [Schistocerca gregaria]|uniref:PX domain-containing protein kinase-like protein isoform X1 n=1 Tax=Schistocerca gregaria TaxID=7010 RepID=UPI00211E3930|nr:PX domain-containing protein kinase-like protein isoform X1 [Schistocerca gregaria]